jgi:hypothetical protein
MIKLVAICLGASVVEYSESLIGEPSVFVPVPQVIVEIKEFVANTDADDLCCNFAMKKPVIWLYTDGPLSDLYGLLMALQMLNHATTIRFPGLLPILCMLE